MPSATIQHALGLHLYQPPGNLRHLLQMDEAEAGRILRCYERIARHAHKYAQVARLHVALSVVLLEQLRDPELIAGCRHLADLPAILEDLRSAPSIEFVGTGYRHAPLPLIPPDDWDEQLRNERVTVEAVLGRVLKGYWPPASLFTAAMVPALARAGYEYVLLPHALLAAPDGGGVDPYRPYRLSHEGAQITVVPLDAGFSHAQENGLEAPWLADEVRNGVAQSPPAGAPHLLTTWTDGENGEWFRRVDEAHGFFGQFFSPYMEFVETGEFPVRPVHLSDYLGANRPATAAALRAEASAASIAGGPPEEAVRPVRERLFRSSARYWSLVRAGTQPVARSALLQARELILLAEDSGLLLGDADRHAAMLGLLDSADRLLGPTPIPAAPQPKPSPALPAAPAVAHLAATGPAGAVPAAAATGTAEETAPTPKAAPAADVAKGPAARKPKGPAGRAGRRKRPKHRS